MQHNTLPVTFIKRVLYFSFKIILFSFLLINTSSLYAQGIDCASAEPFCTDGGTTFPAGVDNGSFAEAGNDYDCLISQPNGAWYYLEVSAGGNLNIDLTSSPEEDIDFVAWGPFSSIANAQAQCGSLSSVVDCSFSASSSEDVNIQGVNVGEVYILLITNYSNSPTEISAQSANNNTATTDCTIVTDPPCNANAGTISSSTTGGGSGNSLVLCDGESASLFSNDDYTLPSPETGEVSELMYAIYNCLPNGGNPDFDPCFSGLFWSAEDFDEASAGAFATNNGGFPQAYIDAGITGDGNGTVWYVPITVDDSDEGGNPNGLINFDQDGDGCYDLGAPISISFPDIPTVQIVSDCDPITGMGSIEVTVNGNGSFTINETGAGNVQGFPGSVSNGDVFTIENIGDGQTWAFTLNAGGCSTPFDGTFSCNDDLCLVDGGITANPPASAFPGGLYPPNTTVTFCVDIGQYNQSNVNFLHGIVPSFGNGWTNLMNVSNPSVAANNEDGSFWDWLPPGSVQENASGASINDFGWWFFSVNSPDGFGGQGLPSDTNDSWGDGCTAIIYPTSQTTCESTIYGEYIASLGGCTSSEEGPLWVGPDPFWADIFDPAMNQSTCETIGGVWDDLFTVCIVQSCTGNETTGNDLSWEACFELTTVSESSCLSGSNDLSVSVNTYADGVTGIWTDPGCLSDSPIESTTEELCCIPNPSGNAPPACEGSPITLNGFGSGMGVLTWYTEPSGGIAIGTGSPFDASSLSPGNYTFYLEEDNGGCTSDRVPVNVTVNPLPEITPISPNQEICNNAIGQSVTLTVSSSNSVSWSWPGGSASGTSINVNPSVSTAYTATATNSCGSTEVVIAVSIIECCSAEAGSVTGTAQNVCPNNDVTAGVSGNNTDAAYTQTYLLVDAAGNVVEVNPTGTFTLTSCTETYTIYSYNYETAGGSPTNPSTIAEIDCVANCCDLEESTFTVSAMDTEAPVFTSPPGNVTVECDAVPAMNDLDWTDNCSGSGSVTGSESGTVDPCGYDLIREWTYTDDCNNPVTHTQTITVNPAPEASFSFIPPALTLACNLIPDPLPSFDYNNGGTGDCAISGTATAVQTGSYNACGGNLVFTYSFTDDCNRTITDEIAVTIEPAPAPTFTSPPADITVECSAVPATAPDLDYTNGETGTCAITGSVTATQTGSYDSCGGSITYTWNYSDDCNDITHAQIITINPAPAPTFNSLPADMTVTCDNVPVTAPDLDYTNGETGTCAITGSVTAVQTGSYSVCGGMITYTWTYSDACGNNISHSQDITVDPASEPTFSPPPANVTASCSADVPAMTDLSYNNGQSGTCAISGMVSGTDVSDNNTCPETITRTWTYTDDCNRTITEMQTIQISDTEMPVFDTPPADVVLPCGAAGVPPMTDLNWTDNCDGSGTVSGTDMSDGGSPEVITRTWTYTDACNNTATETQTITINEFNIDQALAGLCNDNGTLSDATDDFFDVTVNATIGVPGVSNSFTVNDGTTTYGPFTYGTGGPIPGLPADGSTITLTFTDSDDPACTETTTVSQASCSTSCSLTIENSTASACDNGGTPSDPSDDTFTVTVDASAVNGDANFMVTDGDDTWGPFLYGTGGTITLPADGTTFTLTFTDAVDTGCAAQTTVSQASCSDLCALTIDQALAGLCDDNGTPTDDTDDIFDITVNASALNGAATYTVFDGTNTYGPFNYNTPQGIPGLPADGSTITLTFTDADDPACTATTTVSQASCSNTCALTIDDATASACDDNGTPSDDSDDTFDVSVNASAVNGGTQYTVTDGNTVWGPFDYGTPNSIPDLTADGSTITLTFADVNTPSCAAQTTVSQASCSDLCALTIDQALAGLCDDNGTPTDDTDDIFDITVNVSALNGAATYTVFDGTNTYGPFNYNTPQGIPGLPADGSTITLTFTDADDPACTATTTVSQASCSNTCALTIDDATASACDDNGTPSDDSDDTFDVSVNASAVNGGTQYTVTDGNTVWGPFDYGTPNSIPDLTADGSTITLTFADVNTPSCAAQTTVSQASCSDLCALTIDQALAGLCDDNGTPTDNTDDIFDITVNASALNGAATYTVFDGTNTYGPFNYNTPQGIPGLPADGSTITLTFTDADDPACTATTTVSQASCSNTCALTIDDATASACDDNGTPSDDSDDTFDVSVNANAVNGGTQYTVTDGNTVWGPFDYGTPNSIPDLTADGSTITLTFADVNTPSCAAQTTVSQASCSDLCALTIDQALAGLCDDNGTPTDNTDDIFDITVNASTLNGAATYTVFDGTNTYGPFNYNTPQGIPGLPADGSTITLTFTDADDPACTATTTVSQASCSNTCALTIDDATASACDDNGTPSDDSDDTFDVSVNASAVNGGTQYTVTDGNTVWGPFDYGTPNNIPDLTADGSTITLTFADVNTPSCAAQTTVSQASCSDLCALTIAQSDIGLCDDNGTSSDPSDDTFSVSVAATAINGSASGYMVSDGAMNYGPFAYGVSETISGLLANGTNITLTFTDVDDNACSQDVIVTQNSCSDLCVIIISEETIGNCDDNGTPSDASDDIFNVSVNAIGINQGASFTVTDGIDTWGPFNYNTGGTVTGLPANGNNITLTFIDSDDSNCTEQTTVSQTSCSDQCVLTIDNTIIGLCNNNGTLSDPSDDTYNVTVEANSLNGNGSYEVTSTAGVWGPFNYGVNAQITGLPADGSNITLTFVDILDFNCFNTVIVSQVSCSTNCVLTVEDATQSICNDNGTPTDPTDDTFNVTVDASAVNGGTGFNVTANGVTSGPFNYGTGGTIPNLPADGMDITLTFVDIDDPGCANQVIVNQASCSDECDLSVNQAVIGVCNNNGTTTDATDDTFSVSVVVSALNGGGTYIVSDGTNNYGPFVYGNVENINGLPADGSNITLTFTDSVDSNCMDFTIVSQNSCSNDCQITITEETIGACDDNGTPTDATDDTFSMTVSASSLNGGTSYFINSSGTIWGPFNYDTPQVITGLPAGGFGANLIFSDIDDGSCAAQTNAFSPTCSDDCVLNIDQTVIGLCDNNNTPTNPNDDTFEASLFVSAVNGGTNYIIDIGAITYGPFTYGANAEIPDLPADGSIITLIISDVDNPDCSTSTTVTQNSCSTLCQLAVTDFNIGDCDDNDTPTDATDDFFSVTLDIEILNGSSNFIVSDGTLSWGPFAAVNGVGTATIDNLMANGTGIMLFVFDDENASCATQIEVSQNSCSDECAFTIEQTAIGLCDNNGTLSDATDDTYSVTVDASTVNGGTQFSVFDGTDTYGPFDYGTGGVIEDLPANGSVITLTFSDVDDADCLATTTVSQVSCSTNCELSIETIVAGACQSNGTPSDASDDTFDVTVDASSINGGTQFNVTDGNETWGPFSYGTGGMVTGLTANGNNITLTFTDLDNGGCANQEIVSQVSCSDLCALSIEQAIVGLCDNNGTTSDPNDDTFDVTVNASALNGGAQFSVFDGTDNYGPFDYGTGGIIENLPANGSVITLTFTDVDDANCFATTTVSQVNCSTNCELSIETIVAGACQSNGTPSDASDDTFDVTVDASAINGGTQFNVTDGNETWGPFSYGTGGMVTGLTANGNNITLTFTDIDNGGCANQGIVSQISCSDLCALSIEQAIVGLCDNNGTTSDPNDDTFDVTVNASALNGAAQFTVSDGTDTYGPFDYGTDEVIENLPADGSIITLTFTDVDNVNCSATTTVTQTSCSSDCVLTITETISANCDDNGTPSDPSDDIFAVTVNAESVNGGTGFTVSDGTNIYGPFDYDIGGTIPNCPANGNTFVLIFTDVDDSNCTAQTTVSQVSCSDLCALTIEQTAIGLCDNAGTLSDATDDTYNVTVNASALNGAATFTVFDGTNTYGPFDYGTGGIIEDLPADGSIINLTFIDSNDANCSASTTVTQVSCSTNCILTVEETTQQPCFDNGTPSDPSDDTFDIILNISAINGSGQYTVSDGVTVGGPYNYGEDIIFPNCPADGSDYILTITDVNDGGCATQVIVNQASCSDVCLLNILTATENACDDNGTNADNSDDIYSVDVNAESINGGTEFFVTDGDVTWGPFPYNGGGQITDLPADGSNISLTFYDATDNGCSTETTVSQTSCSSSCILTIESSIIGDCDDNGTGADSTDDVFAVTLNISAVNGNGTYSVFDGIDNYGPFAYGIDETIMGLSADGADITLFISDTNDANCNTQLVVSQSSCSDCNLTADAGLAQTLSCGTPEVTLTGSSNEAGVNYEWTGPAGFPSQVTQMITTNISGTYFLEITNPTTGCTATAEVEVFENPDLPMVTASVNGMITCEENSSAILTANTTVTNPEYTWTAPDGMMFTTATIEVTLAGEYTVVVTDLDANCDSAPDVVVVVENTNPPIAVIQEVTEELNCATIAGGISLNGGGSSIGDTISYQWSFEDELLGTELTQIVNEGGEYILLVTNLLTGCTDAMSVNIEENVQFPIAAAGEDTEINCFFSEVVLDGTGSTILPTITYEWNSATGGIVSGETTNSATVSQEGMYVLTVTETETMCTSMDTVFVNSNTESPAAVIANTFALDCVTDSGTLLGTGSATGQNISYQWSNTAGEIAGATDINLDVDAADTYTLLVFDNDNGCSDTVEETVLSTEEDIQVTAIETDPECFGDENGLINVESITGSNPPFMTSLNGAPFTSSNIYLGLAPGDYTLTVEDALGCTTELEYVLKEADELTLDLGINQAINLGEVAEIPIRTEVNFESIELLMLNTDTLFNCDECDVEVQPTESTDYLGLLVDENGCTTTDIVSIFVRKEADIFVPNIFSPNGNGINDILYPFASNSVVAFRQFLIFDRWGETVFAYYNFPPNDPQYGWNGMLNNEPMNSQVFAWYIEAEMLDGRIEIVKGDVTLQR